MKRRRTRFSGRLTRGLRKTGFHNDLRPRLVTTCGKWVTAPLFMQRTYELPCYNQSETGSILVPGYPFCMALLPHRCPTSRRSEERRVGKESRTRWSAEE